MVDDGYNISIEARHVFIDQAKRYLNSLRKMINWFFYSLCKLATIETTLRALSITRFTSKGDLMTYHDQYWLLKGKEVVRVNPSQL